jgi:carbon-monoxide dehydrogenase small subunit
VKQTIEIEINGEMQAVPVEPHETLLRALRNQAGLTGTKRGCDSGGCGCCTVLVDGKAVYSCMTLVMSVAGRRVTTIEGLSRGTDLDPLQRAFIDAGAVQCGFCTCGIIMAAKELLAADPHPDDDAIRKGIAGNLCRCTGYQKIVDAIKLAAAGNEGVSA